MDWGSFMKLAVPGMLMVCLEWWCFEVGTILSGRYAQVPVAVFYIHLIHQCIKVTHENIAWIFDTFDNPLKLKKILQNI